MGFYYLLIQSLFSHELHPDSLIVSKAARNKTPKWAVWCKPTRDLSCSTGGDRPKQSTTRMDELICILAFMFAPCRSADFVKRETYLL